MAKSRKPDREDEGQRQSRKEILIARKERQQLQRVRLGVLLVVALLLVTVAVALANEYLIAPNRAVATVNGAAIALRTWQERVGLERAQRILFLEGQYEALGGDVGIIQQFAGQTILELQDAEALGQDVLNVMIDEELVRQAAQERGINVDEADIGAANEEAFSYFGGDSPTPQPTATETVMPTPSLTPIPTAVITEVVPTVAPPPTLVPSPEQPQPTPTAVSLESFEQTYGDFLEQLGSQGVSESAYRSVLEQQLYQERLLESLVEEQGVPTEDVHASLFVLNFDDEDEATATLEEIETGDYTTIWNSIRSQPPPSGAVGEAPGIRATEVVWRTQESVASSLGEEVALEAFNMPVNVPSGVLRDTSNVEEPKFVIIMVTGREVRPLSEFQIEAARQELLAAFLDQQRASGVELTEFWRGRAPTLPILDSKFLAPPTPTPAQLPPADGTGDGQIQP